MAQRTRLCHETRVLIVFKQMERSSVKSLPWQRFFNTNAERFSTNIFMCGKYAHYERVLLSS